MTQISRFWNGVAIGDAVEAPYDADDEFAKVIQSLANADTDPNQGFVFPDVLNSLVCTGAASPISIDTGRAIVDGTWYENDAVVTLAVAQAAGYIVLRKDTALQTVRLAVTEGAVLPALVQNRGVTWEYPLCSYTIAAGVVTITDLRTFVNVPAQGDYMQLIYETVLTAPAASITIAQSAARPWSNFSSLQLILTGKSTYGAGPLDTVSMRFNGDATANAYTDAAIQGVFGGGVAESDGVNTFSNVGVITSSQAVVTDADSQSIIDVLIANINENTFHKTWLSRNYGIPKSGDNTNMMLLVAGGLWDNLNAITSITIFFAGTLMAGSTVRLYGYPQNVL